MDFLAWLKKLYSLDTLDTRFTISSTTPPRHAATKPDTLTPGPGDGSTSRSRQNGRSQRTDDLRPSLWRSPEFYFYYFIFITVVPMMFYVSFDVSRRKSKDLI
jgi:protein-cysteine N-palmitoyltransferase HHAT